MRFSCQIRLAIHVFKSNSSSEVPAVSYIVTAQKLTAINSWNERTKSKTVHRRRETQHVHDIKGEGEGGIDRSTDLKIQMKSAAKIKKQKELWKHKLFEDPYLFHF